MGKLVFLIYFCSLGVLSAQMNAQEQNAQVKLTNNSQKRILYELQNISWRYHPGDNPAWASPEYNDSS